MQIKVAKSAGFCFGVKRAVGIAEIYAEKGIPAVTLGEIIHNPTVVENLRRRGVLPIENIDECPKGATVILRSHGVPLSVIEKLEEKGIPYEDATCPFVARIHKIVKITFVQIATLCYLKPRFCGQSGKNVKNLRKGYIQIC